MDVNVFNVHTILILLYGNCIYMNLYLYLSIYLSIYIYIYYIIYIHSYICTRITPLSYTVNYRVMYKDDVPTAAFTLHILQICMTVHMSCIHVQLTWCVYFSVIYIYKYHVVWLSISVSVQEA